MNGRSIAVLGLGRSGIAVARAAKALGAHVRLLDEKPASEISKQEIIQEARSEGIEPELGWSGEFTELVPLPEFIVANPAVPRRHPKLLAAVAAGISVISEVEFAYRISKAPIIAITGTNGKSTTTVMTYLALRGCGVDAVLCGNIFGSGYPEQPLTDAALHSQPDQILVAEVSSFQLEWVVDFQPVAAGISNIRPDHLDRYDSFDEYAATKRRIYARLSSGDGLVISRENQLAWEIPPHIPVFSFGADAPQVGPGKDASWDETNLTILGENIPLESLPFSEPHNLENASMAALLSFVALRGVAQRRPGSYAESLLATDGLPVGIIDGIRTFRGLSHRMEVVGQKNGIRVINNSMCTNPDAVIKSASAIRGRAHLLIGGVNKGLDFAPLSDYLGTVPHAVYLYGRDAHAIRSILPRGEEFGQMIEAFNAATLAAMPGETIVLAPGCASTDQFRDFRERGDVFRNIAKEWLSL